MNTRQQVKKINEAINNLAEIKKRIEDDDTSDYYIDAFLWAVEENVDNALEAVSEDDSGS